MIKGVNVDPDKIYALAVSGGADSMTMLHLFSNSVVSPRFYVVTINHNLRLKGSSDAAFVENYCKDNNIECKRYDIDVQSYCKKMSVSEETGARILRYEIFDKLDCDYVCLAHHKDDNAETVLMHILRGTGLKGASGIKQISGRYFRPLLDYSRAEIISYAETNSVPFVTDETNFETDFTRNYLRHEVMPRLCKINASASDNIVKFAKNAASDDEYLDSLADISEVVFLEKGAEIPILLLQRPYPLAYRILRKVLCRLGVTQDFEKTHFDAVVALANNSGGKMLCLPFDLVAVNDYNKLSLFFGEKSKLWDTEFEVPFKTGEIVTPAGVITVSRKKTKNSLEIDISKIPSSAVIRTRKQGDIFTKFGGGGTKTLNKYLIDKKIPLRERDTLLLVADQNKILVILGVEIADSVKTNDNSQKYYISFTKGGIVRWSTQVS